MIPGFDGPNCMFATRNEGHRITEDGQYLRSIMSKIAGVPGVMCHTIVLRAGRSMSNGRIPQCLNL